MTERHSQRELQIFSRFALKAGGYLLDSIEKRSPPEPDILVATCAGNRMAFELVEIIDEDFAQRTWGQLKLKLRFEQACEQLEQGDKTRIEERVGNALIHIVFDEASTFRARELAIPPIFAYLKEVEAPFVGDLRVRDGVPLPRPVKSLRVSRGRFIGPCFDIDAVGSLGDPTVDAIRTKCEKAYNTPHPVELLAYYELQPELPEELWRPKVKMLLTTTNATTNFRRVWVYDCGSDAVRFSAEVNPTTGRGA